MVLVVQSLLDHQIKNDIYLTRNVESNGRSTSVAVLTKLEYSQRNVDLL
jgi:hypothetical protein